MEIDGETLGIAIMFAVIALPMIFFPHKDMRQSKANVDARLAELDAGAPESHFEERRELEAYRPKLNFSHQTIRWIGIVQLCVALGFVLWSINK